MKNANESSINENAKQSTSINPNEKPITIINLDPYKDFTTLSSESLIGKLIPCIKTPSLKIEGKERTMEEVLFIKYPKELISFYVGYYHKKEADYNECLSEGEKILGNLTFIRDEVESELIKIMQELNLYKLYTEDRKYNLCILSNTFVGKKIFYFKNTKYNFLIDNITTVHIDKYIDANYKNNPFIQRIKEDKHSFSQLVDLSMNSDGVHLLDNGNCVYYYFDKRNNLIGLINSKLIDSLIEKYTDLRTYQYMLKSYNKVVKDIINYSLKQSYKNNNCKVKNILCLNETDKTCVHIINNLNKKPKLDGQVFDYDYLLNNHYWKWFQN